MCGWNTVDSLWCPSGDSFLQKSPVLHHRRPQLCWICHTFGTNLHRISMSSPITVDGSWLNLWETSAISSHTSHWLSFVAKSRNNIKSRDWWRRECPCSSVAQWKRTVYGQELVVLLAFAIMTPSGLPPFVAWLVCTRIIMSASSWVQRANSSRSIMWLLVKSSFDINDHILSLFLRKMRQLDGIFHLFDTLHLTNVLA